MTNLRQLTLAWLIIVSSLRASAQESTNKCNYDLFHPTPTNSLRAFETDRPSKTDTPFTVDAGHFQLETDFANYTHNDNAGIRKNVWEVADTMNLKAGLLCDLELQCILGNYVRADYFDRNLNQHFLNQGFGDTTVRLKYNLFGNDQGRFALALLPFVKIPTATDSVGNHAFEGGVNLPFAAKLPWGFTLNAETGAGTFLNSDNTGHHAAFNNSVVLYHAIHGKLQVYAEFFSSVNARAQDPWLGTADFGLIYQLTENIALDVDTAIGLTHSADDYNVYCGIGVRF